MFGGGRAHDSRDYGALLGLVVAGLGRGRGISRRRVTLGLVSIDWPADRWERGLTGSVLLRRRLLPEAQAACLFIVHRGGRAASVGGRELLPPAGEAAVSADVARREPFTADAEDERAQYVEYAEDEA